MIEISITNEQSDLRIERRRLAAALRAALQAEGVAAARISLALVDDAAIQALNRKFLDHDYPTDVLSFVLDDSDGRLEGEVVVSAQRAIAEGPRYGWRPEEELLLYVIHGALHLAGHTDARPGPRRAMRRREAECLAKLGVAAGVPRRPAKRSRRGGSRR